MRLHKVLLRGLALLVLAAPFKVANAQAGVAIPSSDFQSTYDEAFKALGDLKYPLADSLAKRLLDLRATLSQDQLVKALQLATGVIFTEDKNQNRDSAIVLIKRIVALGGKKMPNQISWQGLDALFAMVVAESVPGRLTFGSRVPGSVVFVGNQSQGPISRLRIVSVPPGVPTIISIRTGNCGQWDTTVVVRAADSVLIGDRQPPCPGVSANAAAQGSDSSINVVLAHAVRALNDIKNRSVDTLTRSVLVNPRANASQLAQARIVLAAALLSEDRLASERHPAEALSVLQKAIRTNPDLTIPYDVFSPSLDSLLGVAKRTGFGMAMTADTLQTLVGSGLAELRVRANKPAVFRLTISPVTGGAAIVTDSVAGTATGTLHFPTMANTRPLFRSGSYSVVVIGIDPQTRDSIAITQTATVTAPELQLVTVPARGDSAKLLPERAKRTGAVGVLSAIWVGGGVFALSNILTGDSLNRKKFSADSKGIPIAAAVAGAVVLFSFRDPGRALLANVASNWKAQADLATSINVATAENARRIAAYRSTITMQTGEQSIRIITVPAAVAPAAAVAQQTPPPNPSSGLEFHAGGLFATGERSFTFRDAASGGTGSLKGFEGLLRGRVAGVSGRYVEGTFAGQPDMVSADMNVLLLPQLFSLVAGFSRRALTSPAQTQWYDFARLGFSSTGLIGSSGLQTQVSGAYYLPFGGSKVTTNAASATTMVNGIEGEASVLWSPPGIPFYVQIGYRTEILNTKTGTTIENAEQIRGLRLGGGLLIGGK